MNARPCTARGRAAALAAALAPARATDSFDIALVLASSTLSTLLLDVVVVGVGVF